METNKIFDLLLADRFTWLDTWGIGYFPVKPENEPYRNPETAKKYFEKYVRYEKTKLGKDLNDFRARFVNSHWKGQICDIGIGCGSFITRRGNAVGYDVNPHGEAWLMQMGLYCSPYVYRPGAITCWDSLEHIRDFYPLISRTLRWAFISTPIYKNREHVLASKHFRPDEHYWYFTHEGLIAIFNMLGFELSEHCTTETALGREDIGSYAFVRTA